MRDRRDWCLAQAWHTANLTLADPKQFPSLQELLGGKRETVDPRAEVAQMMFARLQQINERNTQRPGGSE